MEKICFKCNQKKPLSEYYKHSKMGDGHLNKCKDCTKKESMNQYNKNITDEKWLKKERKRGRDKYYRLGYKEKNKPSTKQKKKYIDKYFERYPEKKLAKSRSANIDKLFEEKHHWSYKEEHHKDVIHMTSKNHYKAHRFIIYDQERMMYRRSDNNELLDTKEKHLSYIMHKIKTEED